MTIEIIEDIRNKIASDCLKEAIRVFRDHCSQFENELIIQSNKYTRLNSEIRKGIISREQSNLERNRLCNALLELLNEVDVSETNLKNENHKLNPELRDILGLAELISRRKGKDRTSTKDFFKALATIKPESLESIIEELNDKAALPKPVKEEVLTLPRRLSNSRVLSGCLTESLEELNKVITDSNQISTADMFIDVSKHGKGKSVSRLRKKGITKSAIDNYVNEFSIEIQKRRENEVT